MTYTATDSEAIAQGFILPNGTDLIRNGDDAIKHNAKTAAGAVNSLATRLNDLEQAPAAAAAPTWADVTDKPTTFPPTAHAASHATGGSDPIEPADIGAATAAQGTKADSAVQPDDVADVIREGDARLTDARTPTSHTHVYADITDPPTIPGPQTLSLTGSDLTLSDGGGTVTLPSGGGGGNPWAALIRTPAIGQWMTTPGIVSNGTNTGEIRSTNTMPLIVPAAMSIDAVAFKVGTAEASATWTVDLLAADGTTLIATLGSAPLDTTGDKTITFTAQTLAPGGYFIRGTGHTWNVAKFAAARVNGWGSGVRPSPFFGPDLPMPDLHGTTGHLPNVPLFYVRRSA